jgi:hypothetical protein
MRTLIILVVAIIATVITANIANGIMLKGAQAGGEGISKDHTIRARIDPEGHSKSTYPVALGMGSIVGLVVFAGGYFITKPKKK